MAEMAWSQGDDLYGELDNRPLLGMEFMNHYNLSIDFQFPDQPTRWEPTTDSGEYIRKTDRSGRFEALAINPEIACDGGLSRGAENYERPIYELVLGHYRDRLNLPSDDYKWMQRGQDVFINKFGIETTGVVTDHPVWGSLTFHRVSPGDPISGFDFNGLPQYAMNMLPGTVEAENFDFFAGDGQGRTYSDTTPGNSGSTYRFDSDVDVQATAEGGFYVGATDFGEFLTYTVNVPETGDYTIRARVASSIDNNFIRFSFRGVDRSGIIGVPNTGDSQNFTTFNVAEDVRLSKGVQQVKVETFGTFTLDNFSVNDFLLGDVNRDGEVDFDDISTFISLLSTGSFQAEADINGDTAVSFDDISPFIVLLSGN